MSELKLPCEVGDVSDGYHTFNELYEHRHNLLLAFMKSNPSASWISQNHNDGTWLPGWFTAGVELNGKHISYHLPMAYWDLATCTGATVMDRAPEWDGHSSNDVLNRIREWVEK